MNNPNQELVSICIPTYNGEQFIERTIQSVLNQSYKNIEIVICDDGSTDNTVVRAESFNDSRVKIFVNKINLGLTANWNKAIENASGTYVKLLCGDDLLHPQCIEKQVEILQKDINKHISLVACLSNVIDDRDEVIFVRKNLLKSGINDSRKAVSRSIWLGTNIIGEPMTGLFRKELFDSGCRYDGSNSYLIDFDFWIKVLNHGVLYVVPEHLASFRISSQSISSSLQLKQYSLYSSFIKSLKKNGTISMFTYLMGRISAFILVVPRNLVFMRIRRRNK